MVLGQLDSLMQKNGVGPLPNTIYKKKKFKMINDLNVRTNTVKKVKRQPTEWEKFLQAICLIRDFRIYTELLQFNIKNQTTASKMIKDLDRHFSKGNIQIASSTL